MRLLRPHLLTLAAGVVAALPVIAGLVRAITMGWTPLGDRAAIAVRSLDVLSTHPPLLGQYSASSQVLGEAVHSPGPLLYWLLALPVRVAPPAAAIAIALLNIAVVMGLVAVARRRGGVGLMLAVTAGIPLVLASLDPALPYDIWNPAAGLLPFTLVMFLAWSLACGDWRLLPLTALAVSFTVQTHFGYAIPIAAALAVAAVFFVRARPPVPRRWWLATLAVLAVCWAAPLAESVIHRPGNFEQIVRTALADKPTFGFRAGIYGASRTIGVPAWWLRPPVDVGERVDEVVFAPPAAAAVSAALVALALALLTALALRRGERAAGAAGTLALALVAAVVLTIASSPTQGVLFGTIGYALWWAHPAGAFAYMALGALAVRLLPGRLPALQPALGLAAAALVAVAVVATSGDDRLGPAYGPARELSDAVKAKAPPGAVLVEGTRTPLAFELQGAAILALRQRGPRPRSRLLPGLGTPYNPALNPPDAELGVNEGRPPRGARVIARPAPRVTVSVPDD